MTVQFKLTDNLTKLIKIKEDKFSESDIKIAIKLHVTNFLNQNKTNTIDVYLQNFDLDIRIKKLESNMVLVGLTKPLNNILNNI